MDFGNDAETTCWRRRISTQRTPSIIGRCYSVLACSFAQNSLSQQVRTSNTDLDAYLYGGAAIRRHPTQRGVRTGNEWLASNSSYRSCISRSPYVTYGSNISHLKSHCARAGGRYARAAFPSNCRASSPRSLDPDRIDTAPTAHIAGHKGSAPAYLQSHWPGASTELSASERVCRAQCAHGPTCRKHRIRAGSFSCNRDRLADSRHELRAPRGAHP